jgi:hypothetical protein
MQSFNIPCLHTVFLCIRLRSIFLSGIVDLLLVTSDLI